MANPKTGLFLIGLFKGIFERTTERNGKKYTNRFIALITGEFENRYQEKEEQVEEVAIYDDQQYIDLLKSDYKNKTLIVPVRQNCKYGVSGQGKNYGFIATYLPKDCKPEIYQQAVSKVS